MMKRYEAIDCLNFKDQFLLDNKIHPVAAIEAKTFVNDGQRNLPGIPDSVMREFEAKAFLVG